MLRPFKTLLDRAEAHERFLAEQRLSADRPEYDFSHFPPIGASTGRSSWLLEVFIYDVMKYTWRSAWTFHRSRLPRGWEEWVRLFQLAKVPEQFRARLAQTGEIGPVGHIPTDLQDEFFAAGSHSAAHAGLCMYGSTVVPRRHAYFVVIGALRRAAVEAGMVRRAEELDDDVGACVLRQVHGPGGSGMPSFVVGHVVEVLPDSRLWRVVLATGAVVELSETPFTAARQGHMDAVLERGRETLEATAAVQEESTARRAARHAYNYFARHQPVDVDGPAAGAADPVEPRAPT